MEIFAILAFSFVIGLVSAKEVEHAKQKQCDRFSQVELNDNVYNCRLK